MLVKRHDQLCVGSQLKLKADIMILHPILVNNLVKVGNVDNTAVAVEANHCKAKWK